MAKRAADEMSGRVANKPQRRSVLGPEARDREGRMRAMIEAAIELFAEEGYGPVSTRRIAERAQCSETLLFRYFGGKRGLLIAICNELINVSSGNPFRNEDFGDLHDYIQGYLRHMWASMGEHAQLHKIVAAALITDPDLSAEFEERHDVGVEHAAAGLRRFQASGEIGPQVDVQAIATGLEQMGWAIGVLMVILYSRPATEIDAIATSYAAALSQGLRDEAPTELPESQRLAAVNAARSAELELTKIVELLQSDGAGRKR